MRSILLLGVLLMSSQLAFADAAADIAYRQGVMKSVGGHMASIGAILRGQVHFEDLASHSNAMAELSKIVPKVFPAGSGDGKTEALPAIWGKPDAFKSALDKFVEAAGTMATAGSGGDPAQIGAAVRDLGQSCKGCHDDFREEHEH